MIEYILIKLIIWIFGSSALCIIVLLYLFNRPDKFEHWMKIFYKVIYPLTKYLPEIKRTIDKKLVAVSIQDTVNQISDQINEESPEVFPHALKIEWVKSDIPDAFISNGKVILRLKHYENQDRNIVGSALLYIKHGFLPLIKNYLDKTLCQSCEYKVASRIFSARRDAGAYPYFFSNELMPALSADPKIQNDLEMLESLDNVGFFTRVFLSEITVTRQKLLGTVPTETVKRKLREFAKFLETIARKGKDEKVPLSFNGTKVSASVILVAKHETIDKHGIKPYIRRIKRCLREGYESIYLAGWGEEFIGAVIQIKKQIEGEMLTIIRRYDYPVHGTVKAILMVCQPKSGYLSQQKRLHDEVRNAFADIVPEVREGSVKIMSIARKENIGCKVAVKAIDPEVENPIRCCIGKDAERLKELKERIPGEFIGVTLWSDDMKDFITKAISTLNPRYIDDIQIDEENLIANVTVRTNESVSKAIGKGGNNVKLASELTGYLINIQLLPSLVTYQSPEDELMAILKLEIPEILNSDIEVVRIARIKEIGSKVIVKWRDTKLIPNHRASETCYGFQHDKAKRIKQYLSGEWIHFHDWYQTPEEQIALCLYPVKSHEIQSVEIDDPSRLAVVTLNRIPDIVLTESDPNLVLCEEVTGYQIEIMYP